MDELTYSFRRRPFAEGLANQLVGPLLCLVARVVARDSRNDERHLECVL